MIELVNEFGRGWAGYYGIAVIQNTAFLGLVFLFLHLARNAPARLKYSIGLFGLCKLLLPPFIPTGMLAYSPIAASYYPLTSIDFSFATSPPTTESAGSSAPALSLIGFVFISWIVPR